MTKKAHRVLSSVAARTEIHFGFRTRKDTAAERPKAFLRRGGGEIAWSFSSSSLHHHLSTAAHVQHLNIQSLTAVIIRLEPITVSVWLGIE